jgi:hypothetical protein
MLFDCIYVICTNYIVETEKNYVRGTNGIRQRILQEAL